MRKPKEVTVIEHAPGVKTVARKTSYITRIRIIASVIAVVWISFVAWAPLYVKNHYSDPIKKSIVVSMFFDMQNYIQEQYEKVLKSVAGSIDLSKPIAAAVDKVKLAQGAVAKVDNVSDKAKETTDRASRLSGIAGRLGVNTGGVDKVIDSANAAVAKVDDTTAMVNSQLDKIKNDLERVANTEIDKAMDEQIKKFLDKNTGIGTTLLTDYGIDTVRPWRPDTWPVTTKIYNDLQKSNLSVLQTLTGLVNKYFDYAAWGLVIAAWLAGLYILSMVMKWYKTATAPFIVCPRCGYTFADKKRVALSILKIFQPWTWFGI
ncbi:MAG: hypothetical protein LBR41_03425 [Rickettsiales bacterium]|jgi:hypothetical protein|nr:hypothetical protein [Rickettsiales bacterium]